MALAAGGVHFWQSKSSFENEQANIQNSKDVADTMKTPALKTDNVAVSEMTEDGKKEITNKLKRPMIKQPQQLPPSYKMRSLPSKLRKTNFGLKSNTEAI